MNNFFNKELYYRLISVLVFIPIAILPIIFSNYLSVVIYLLFTSIIVFEIDYIKIKVNKKNLLNIYLFLIILSFFSFLFLLITEKYSVFFLILIIFTIWLFDTFSFIGGRIFGGSKLMPNISSGKTVSGLISGVVFTLVIIQMQSYLFDNSIKFSIIFTIVIIILSFLGDTLASIIKRFASVKDSGKIMPGHGGLLDRFDSFTMVFFILGFFNLVI